MISHLLLVGFRLFHHCSLISYILASVGTRDEVGGTITRGERAPDGLGDTRAFFWMSQMSVVVGKAVVDQSAVRARRAMPLGVGIRVQKVWGELVGYRPSNEGVLLRPSLRRIGQDCVRIRV